MEQEMDVKSALLKRKSTRAFLDKEVSLEIINAIIDTNHIVSGTSAIAVTLWAIQWLSPCFAEPKPFALFKGEVIDLFLSIMHQLIEPDCEPGDRS